MQSEIDSFVSKFRNFTQSGRDANLTLVAKAGKVSVNLDVSLGSFSQPPWCHHQHQPPQIHQTRNGASASYQRRLKRRAEARSKAAEEAAKNILPEEAGILDLTEEAFVPTNIAVEESTAEAAVMSNENNAKIKFAQT